MNLRGGLFAEDHEYGPARSLHGVQDRPKLRLGFCERDVFGGEDRLLVGGLLPRKPEGMKGELLGSVWVALSETEEHVHRFRRYAPAGILEPLLDELSKALVQRTAVEKRVDLLVQSCNLARLNVQKDS